MSVRRHDDRMAAVDNACLGRCRDRPTICSGQSPVLIEPAFYLTCCIIWSSDHSLSLAADGVRELLIEFLRDHIRRTKRPGAVWLD